MFSFVAECSPLCSVPAIVKHVLGALLLVVAEVQQSLLVMFVDPGYCGPKASEEMGPRLPQLERYRANDSLRAPKHSQLHCGLARISDSLRIARSHSRA